MEFIGEDALSKDSKLFAIMIIAGIIIVFIGLMIQTLYGYELALLLIPLLLASLVFISMRLQGIPISIKSALGKSVKKVPHYITENGVKRSIPREWRMNLINNVLDPKKDKIRAVCGECNNIDSIESALKRNFFVELMCGPAVKDKNTRDKIENLLRSYPNKFSVYILDKRPKKHSTLLGNNILLESVHNDVAYEKAVLIENANECHVSHFIAQFENQMPKNKAAIDDIKNMKLYSED